MILCNFNDIVFFVALSSLSLRIFGDDATQSTDFYPQPQLQYDARHFGHRSRYSGPGLGAGLQSSLKSPESCCIPVAQSNAQPRRWAGRPQQRPGRRVVLKASHFNAHPSARCALFFRYVRQTACALRRAPCRQSRHHRAN